MSATRGAAPAAFAPAPRGPPPGSPPARAAPASPPAGGACWSWLSEEGVFRVLSFLVAALPELPAVAAASRQLHEAAAAPGAWDQARVCVPRKVVDEHLPSVLKLGMASWSLAAEVRLAACTNCLVAQRCFGCYLPQSRLAIDGNGPYLCFSMTAMVAVGSVEGLHLFEPRYRWMCQRLLALPGEPREFCWITDGGPCEGASGYLCEVLYLGVAHGGMGTFDVRFRVGRPVSPVMVWGEAVPWDPRAPQLPVTYVDFIDPPVAEAAGPAPDEAWWDTLTSDNSGRSSVGSEAPEAEPAWSPGSEGSGG